MFYLMCDNKLFVDCMVGKWYFIEYDKDLLEYSLIKSNKGYNMMGFLKRKDSDFVEASLLGGIFKKGDKDSFDFWFLFNKDCLNELYKALLNKGLISDDVSVNDFINKYDPMTIDLIGMDHLTYDLYRVMSNGFESKYWGRLK